MPYNRDITEKLTRNDLFAFVIDDGLLFAGILEMSTATENSIRFSGHTLDKATKAKVTLENYYSNLISQHVERKQRYPPLYTHL